MKIILRIRFRAFGITFHQHEQVWKFTMPWTQPAKVLYDKKGVYLRIEAA